MNVGEWREGTVVKVNDDGSVDVEWSDGTTTTLPRKKAPARKPQTCGNPQCLCNPDRWNRKD